MRVMERKSHLLRDNPLLRELESVGNKDSEYSSILHAIRTGQSNKSLPSNSEAYKMGGEWHIMSIMEEAEIICISRGDGIDRIYPPKGFREKIIKLIHKGGKHLDIVLATCALHYRWPKMRNDIKTHVANCKSCFQNSPSKTEA